MIEGRFLSSLAPTFVSAPVLPLLNTPLDEDPSTTTASNCSASGTNEIVTFSDLPRSRYTLSNT